MLFKTLTSILCFYLFYIAAPTNAYEEITPTATSYEVYTRDTDSCSKFRIEVKLASRRLGFLGFDAEMDATVTRDASTAEVFSVHDGELKSKGRLVGSRQYSVKRHGYAPVKLLHTKPPGSWQDADRKLSLTSHSFTFGNGAAGFCYTKKAGRGQTLFAQYTKSAPSSMQCKAVTFQSVCVRKPRKPNPSDTPSSTKSKLQTRDDVPRKGLWAPHRNAAF